MKFGLLLVSQYDESRPMRGISDELAAQTELARDVGFDGVTVGEHHVTDSDQYLLNEAVVAHVAEHVGEMDLWTTLCLLPYHNPVRIAEFGATIDVLTGGRFRLGVGLGYRQAEYDAFGVSKADAPGRLIEGVEIIKRLWTQESVTYHGKHFTLEDVSIRPQPLQDPRPPIWVGASNESSVRRAGRIADGFIGAHVPFNLARRQVDDFYDERGVEGIAGGEVGFIREAFVAATEERAERTVRGPLMDKYESYSDWGQDDAIEADDFGSPWEKLRHERFLVGSPDDVVADIERYREELDLDYLVVRTQFPGNDFEDVRESIRLFGEEVIPAFR
ncbi:LLM class flavin-dependent oxidoreductase [Halegenticoccus tardaugens]|uniref:LLM class flavin-dependent oxidoreductase n=1 Tax=Halegenticoccus tardaugens TaxID=2071624 RepID=UPI00100A23DC|nr:LLM class flavin-dependent oxidoreductase [Halegenticoccus tardaugens]